jgi:predicted TIM-barrel fold metal-dependent hydrolase
MVIDADCHISSQEFDSLAITADELIEQMDQAGIDKAIIWLKPPYDRDIAPENKAVYDATKKYPNRLLGFGWANPRLGSGATVDAIKQCFEEYGFLGIKFNGAQDDYVIDDPDIGLPFIEKATQYGKPIAFHIGADFYENTHPYRLGHIASSFPDAQFFMVHMGGAALPALDRSAIEATARNPNITIIGSAIPAQAILSAIHTVGVERVCFGSDTPFCFMHVELAKYRALLRDFDKADQDRVLGANIARVLGLPGT